MCQIEVFCTWGRRDCVGSVGRISGMDGTGGMDGVGAEGGVGSVDRMGRMDRVGGGGIARGKAGVRAQCWGSTS